MRIGFEQASYTFIEPPIERLTQIYLATEESRVSEQTFSIFVEVGAFNSSESYQSALFGEDYVAPTMAELVFHPFTQRISYQFSLFLDDDATFGEAESFSVASSNSHDARFPNFLIPEVLSSMTEVVIIEHDTESILLL